MMSIGELVNSIVTEAIENDESRKDNPTYDTKVPPIMYKLELIERNDGSLYWIE